MSASTPVALLTRKVRSARTRLARALDALRTKSEARRRDQAFASWLRHLENDPPEVLVGSNFAEFGGVRHHLHAIANYSRLNVELAPPESLLRVVSPHDVRVTYRKSFFDFQPRGIKALHSHVFPWFIEWCRSRRSQARWVHTYHLPYFAEHGNGELELWQEDINRALHDEARFADVRLSVSRWQQDWLLENHGIATEYLPNGVDVGKCESADGSRFTQATGLEDFVLYVGRHDPVKNPLEFVRLARAMPRYKFVMLGRELSSEQLARDLGSSLPPNVTVLGDASHEFTLDGIAACRALVVTSKREGLPTLVLEAMALSKQIVVPREAGCLEAVDDGRYGVVYEPGNISDLAEKTGYVVRSEIVRNDARERVLSEYDWRVLAPKLDEIYAG